MPVGHKKESIRFSSLRSLYVQIATFRRDSSFYDNVLFRNDVIHITLILRRAAKSLLPEKKANVKISPCQTELIEYRFCLDLCRLYTQFSLDKY